MANTSEQSRKSSGHLSEEKSQTRNKCEIKFEKNL